MKDRTVREERSKTERVEVMRSMRVWRGDSGGEVMGCIWGVVRLARTGMDLGHTQMWSA